MKGGHYGSKDSSNENVILVYLALVVILIEFYG